jgi:hypothetical protein
MYSLADLNQMEPTLIKFNQFYFKYFHFRQN